MNSCIRNWIRNGLLILFILSLSEATHAAPTLGVDALTRGMKGVGRTVFQGTRIDSFQVEILGVLRNAFGPKTNIILARLSGAPLEKTGGIAGMSGSPVYVDGKLIGAVAYGWSFSIEPIMGITPIDEMLDIMERPDLAALPESIDLADSGALSFPLEEVSAEFDVGQMKRVITPVYMSGFSADIVPELKERLSSFGLMPVQGGGGLDASLPEATLEPGAALGVQLIRGDFNITAIGTLTHVEGDRLVGFGHPMFSSGSTRLPMTTAFIHEVIASQSQSFKLGSAVKQVGAITQDRSSGIGGVIGQEADMIPIGITIRSTGRSESYEMEVLRHRDLGPMLIQAAVVSSLISAEKSQGRVTVKTSLNLKLKGYEQLAFENVYAGPRGLGEGVLGVTRPMQLLLQNPYESLSLETATFDLDVAEDMKAASVASLQLGRSRYAPGDTVKVEISLKPYLGGATPLSAELVIPRYVRDGMLTLRVSSASANRAQESKRVPAEFRVKDVEGLIRALKRESRNDELIVELVGNRRGATVGGQELLSLPPSVLGAMKSSRRSGSVRPVNQSVLAKQVLETPYVLSGQQTVFIAMGAKGQGLRFSSGQPTTNQKKR